MPHRSTRPPTVAVATLLWLLTALVGAPPALGATDATCTPGERVGAVTDLRLDRATGAAYDEVGVRFSGRVEEPLCAGDTATLDLPVLLRGWAGTYPVSDPDGVTVGRTVVDPATGTATLTVGRDVADGPTRFTGYLSTTVSAAMPPGTDHVLGWGTGTATLTTRFTADDCTGCAAPRAAAESWARLDGTTVGFGVESVAALAPGEPVAFVQRLAPGHQVDCATVAAHAASVGAWGQLVWSTDVPVTVTACGPDPERAGGTRVEASAVAATAGGYVVLSGRSTVVDTGLDAYTTTGTVTQRGAATDVSAAAGPPREPSASPADRAVSAPEGGAPTPDQERRRRAAVLAAGLATFALGGALVTLGLRRRH